MTVLVDLVRPKGNVVTTVLSVVAGSLFLGLMAQFALPLWFTPVPLSMFTLGIFLVGSIFGAKKAALTVAAFLFEGACGLPLFAGFSGGIAVLFGPTAGYLFGSVLAAFLIGYLFERGWVKRYSLAAISFIIGNLLILTFGALWLSLAFGIKKAFLMGFCPFILGDLIKVGMAVSLIPSIWKLCKR